MVKNYLITCGFSQIAQKYHTPATLTELLLMVEKNYDESSADALVVLCEKHAREAYMQEETPTLSFPQRSYLITKFLKIYTRDEEELEAIHEELLDSEEYTIPACSAPPISPTQVWGYFADFDKRLEDPETEHLMKLRQCINFIRGYMSLHVMLHHLGEPSLFDKEL